MAIALALFGSTTTGEWNFLIPPQTAANHHLNTDEFVSAPDDTDFCGFNNAIDLTDEMKIKLASVPTNIAALTRVAYQFRYLGVAGPEIPTVAFGLWSLGAQVGADITVNISTGAAVRNGQVEWTGLSLTQAQANDLSVRKTNVAGGGVPPEEYIPEEA